MMKKTEDDWEDDKECVFEKTMMMMMKKRKKKKRPPRIHGQVYEAVYARRDDGKAKDEEKEEERKDNLDVLKSAFHHLCIHAYV